MSDLIADISSSVSKKYEKMVNTVGYKLTNTVEHITVKIIIKAKLLIQYKQNIFLYSIQ